MHIRICLDFSYQKEMLFPHPLNVKKLSSIVAAEKKSPNSAHFRYIHTSFVVRILRRKQCVDNRPTDIPTSKRTACFSYFMRFSLYCGRLTNPSLFNIKGSQHEYQQSLLFSRLKIVD